MLNGGGNACWEDWEGLEGWEGTEDFDLCLGGL